MKQIYSAKVSAKNLTLAVSYKYEELKWFVYPDMHVRSEYKPIGFFHIIIDRVFFGNRAFRYDIDEVIKACGEDFFNPKCSNHSPSLFLISSEKITNDYFDWLLDRDINDFPDKHIVEKHDVLTNSDYFSKYEIFEKNANELLPLELGFPGYTHFLDGTPSLRVIYFWSKNHEKLISIQGEIIKEIILPLGTCKSLIERLKKMMDENRDASLLVAK